MSWCYVEFLWKTGQVSATETAPGTGKSPAKIPGLARNPDWYHPIHSLCSPQKGNIPSTKFSGKRNSPRLQLEKALPFSLKNLGSAQIPGRDLSFHLHQHLPLRRPGEREGAIPASPNPFFPWKRGHGVLTIPTIPSFPSQHPQGCTFPAFHILGNKGWRFS